MRIAALLSSYNRRELTLSAIRALTACRRPSSIELSVFLLDDASSDGTAHAVRDRYPSATVLDGSGEMYWSGGMRAVFEAASPSSPDCYLWLNDDTFLDEGALEALLQTYDDVAREQGTPPIVVGAVRDPETADQTYGGVLQSSGRHPFRYELAPLQDGPQRVDTFNGNCALIPSEVVDRIGHIDEAFTHALGDFDYGLRAKTAGISIWVAPGTVGTCAAHPAAPTIPAGIGGARYRLVRLLDPTGLPPRDWFVYTRRHGGFMWPLFWVGPYAKALVAGLVRGYP